MPKLQTNGKYKVDLYPHGRKGKRIVRLFHSLESALQFESDIQEKVRNGISVSTQTENLKDLIDRWFIVHGKTLNSGLDRYKMMLNACEKMGNPLVNRFNKAVFLKYRSSRIGVVSNNTINHELVYFRSLFSKLIELDIFHFRNPLDSIKQLKQYETELAFLTIEQVAILLDALKVRKSKSAYMVTMICLSTGARWSEVEALTSRSLRQDLVSFVKTKNKKVRHVPVSKDLSVLIKAHLSSGGSLKGSYSTFKVVFKELDFDIPKGQMSHVLRHSFSSHFIMNGGNILALQKLLGHSDIKMTMRYAHLAPEFYNDAVKFNPVTILTTV
ncbi:MAG: hypothetical protein ISEC1_P2060 [Thiomicrorhabdus sp.]|nr:MAG: hypothetical protein ISEC1_P2060 [Thiomicrorhabdus sp.]